LAIRIADCRFELLIAIRMADWQIPVANHQSKSSIVNHQSPIINP
jgi:hypothetical protein